MNLKVRDLTNLEVCEKKFELSRMMVTEKNKYYYISLATKNAIKKMLMLSDTKYKQAISGNEIVTILESSLPDDVFLPLVKNETIKELSEQVTRYLAYIKENDYELLAEGVINDIKVNGEVITVSSDFIFKTANGLEVVKIKRKQPDLSYAARVDRSKPSNNIELYLLQALGEEVYPEEKLSASFHHMTGKNDKKNPNMLYEAKRGYNVITFEFEKDSENTKEINIKIAELIGKTNSVKFNKSIDEQDCRVCPYANICGHKKTVNTELKEIEISNKAPSSFEPTKSQLSAILFEEGIARINAGAGSGKTTVVALRVVELILDGCRPEDILLVTFTNKGAAEMREKISYWLEKEGEKVNSKRFNITTFNAWGDKIIMENFEKLGFTQAPVLIEKVQKYDILFKLLKDFKKLEGFDYKNPVMNFKHAKGAVSKLNSIFDYIKSYNVQTAEDLTSKYLKVEANQVIDMYNRYNEILRENNLIEYQDQINLLVELTEGNSEIMANYNYEHIIVDEFQDSDSMQIDLILYLSVQPKFRSLMVVGDDSQSIFGFRNTSQDNILKFHTLFDNVKDVEIIENFRSTPEIIELANALNNKNTKKIDKQLISGAKSGEIPTLIGFDNHEHECDFISKEIEKLMNEYNPEDFAVIARTKFELFGMQEYLDAKNIPYVLDVPEPLLNNNNVHLAKSLLTFLNDFKITQGIFEYLYIMTDGFEDMNKSEVKLLVAEEVEIFKDIIEEAKELDDDSGELVSEVKLDLFYNLLDTIEDKAVDSFSKELQAKNYNFKQLKEYIYKFMEYEDGKTIEKDDKKYSAVTLTTAHTSKGKEFPVVFTMLSKYSAQKTAESMDEERRTLFVAITRAKEKLYMTYQAEKPNSFSKSFTGYPKELAETGKCRVGRGIKQQAI